MELLDVLTIPSPYPSTHLSPSHLIPCPKEHPKYVHFSFGQMCVVPASGVIF